MADINKFTTKEVLNKVLLDSSGNSVAANSHTSQEALNAVLDTANNRLNVSLGGSNTISGDVTITGDLTVQGGGSLAFDEIIEGTSQVKVDNTSAFLVEKADGTDVFIVDTTNSRVSITDTLNVNPTISSGSKTTLAFQRSGTNKWRFIQPFDDSYLKLYNDGASATQMYFASNNNVGIGTTSPNKQLHVHEPSAGSSHVAFTNTDTGTTTEFLVGISSGEIAELWNENNTSMRFATNDTERMRIDNSGNVGIGTASPAYTLAVEKSVTGDWLSRIYNTATSGNPSGLLVRVDDSDSTGILFGANANGSYRFVVKPDGNVGIGTASPAEILELEGTSTAFMQIQATSADSTSGISLQNDAINYVLRTNGANSDSFEIRDATNNAQRLILDTNSRISLSNNDSGSGNTVFGYLAGQSIDAGSDNNVFIGERVADATLNDASNNIGLGYYALSSLTIGDNNVVIGSRAGLNITGTSATVLIGKQAGESINNASAVGSIGIGQQAIKDVTNGTSNTAMGYTAGKNLTDGGNNTILGFQAMSAGGTSASQCTGIGMNALLNATGSNNTSLGYNSGDLITSGTLNTVIGYTADTSANDATNQTVIGASATGQADNSVVLGNADVTDVYMAQDKGAKIHGATADLETNITGGGHVLYLLNDGNSNNRTGIKIQVGAYTPSSAGDNVFATFFDGNGSALGGIQNSSNVDLPEFFEGSDERIKDNIKDTEVNALEVINSLQFREFNKKNQSKKTKIGLVAQEVLKSKIPELVGTGSNESYKEYFDEDENEMYTIGIGNMTYYLMKAVQELSAKVAELEKK